MKKRITILAVGSLIMGVSYLNNRTVPDQHVFANSGNSSSTSSNVQVSEPADPTATPTPTPVAQAASVSGQISSRGHGHHGDKRGNDSGSSD